MTVVGEAFIEVRPKTENFDKDVTSKVTSIAKKAAAIFAGAAVVSKGFDFIKGAVADAREQNKVTAQTEAVIKSTGNAANLSSDQILGLVDALERKTAVDGGAIQEGANLLLTFKNIRNEAGAGNDIFNQTTGAMVDLAAAMGTDVKGGAIQLGKALNDPVKGIAALSRVGITFTKDQEEVIKSLVAGGKTMDAQKIILAELNSQFGGSAAAQADAGDRLRVVFDQLKERVGQALLPALDSVATFVGEHLPAAFDRASKFIGPIFATIAQTFRTFVGAFNDPDVTSSGFFGFVEQVAGVVRGVVDQVRFLTGVFIDAFQDPDVTSDGLVGLIERIAGVVRKLVDVVSANLKPILIGVGVAIAALTAPITTGIAALVLLYTRFEFVRDIVNTVLEVLGGLAAFVIDKVLPALIAFGSDALPVLAQAGEFLVGIITGVVAFIRDQVLPVVLPVFAHIVGAIGDLVAFVQEHFPAIAEAIGHVLEVVKTVITVALAPIVLAWRVFGDEILAVVRIAFDFLKSVVETGIRVIRDVIVFVISIINGDWGAAWNAIKDIPIAIFDFLVGAIGNILGVIGQVIGGALDLIKGVFSGAWNFIRDTAVSAFNGLRDLVGNTIQSIIDFVTGLPGRLVDLAGLLFEGAKSLGRAVIDGIVDGLKGAIGFVADIGKTVFNALANLVNTQIVDRINEALKFTIPVPFTDGITIDPPDIPHIPKLASGALIKPRPGVGVLANIGEGTRTEAVLPLPPGVIEGLQAIARSGGLAGAGPEIGSVTLVAPDPVQGARELVRTLRAERFRRGR